MVKPFIFNATNTFVFDVKTNRDIYNLPPNGQNRLMELMNKLPDVYSIDSKYHYDKTIDEILGLIFFYMDLSKDFISDLVTFNRNNLHKDRFKGLSLILNSKLYRCSILKDKLSIFGINTYTLENKVIIS